MREIYTARWSEKQNLDKEQRENSSCLIFYSLCIPATKQPSSPPSIPYFYLPASLNYTQGLRCGNMPATYARLVVLLPHCAGGGERWVAHLCRCGALRQTLSRSFV